MEKFTQDSDYNAVVAAAKQFGIAYIGVKKPVIIEKINAKIDAGETIEIKVPVDQNEEVATETGTTAEEGTAQPADATPTTTPKTGRAAAQPRQPRAKKAKWFEEANAVLPYQAGDIVEIIAGDILVGRKAQMTKYSSKQDAIKCILIHPVSGDLQKCEITMDFAKIQKDTAVAATPAAPTEETSTEQETLAVDEQPVINPEVDGQEQDNKEEESAV